MTLRMRVLPRFPAKIFGSTGIKIVRPDGSADITVSLDVSDIVRVSSVDDNTKVFFIAWNSYLDTYSIMSFADTFAAVIDTTGLMLDSVYDPQNKNADAFARANHTGQQAIATITNLQSTLDSMNTAINSKGPGNVVGPASAADNFPVAFDATTGKLIKAITGAIAALHSLTPAADRLPYFNGSNSAALATFTAFARTILDDANGAAMFATMGATLSTGGSGYTKLPNGLLIQWGFVTNTGSQSSGSASFPISFPSGCVGVWPSRFATNSAAYSISINWGPSGFGWYDSGSSFPAFCWFAIGY